jgi:hypothetical protein
MCFYEGGIFLYVSEIILLIFFVKITFYLTGNFLKLYSSISRNFPINRIFMLTRIRNTPFTQSVTMVLI